MDEHKLYRSQDDRLVGGVCGGIAEYFDMDPSIIRLLVAVLAIVGNAAIAVAYVVMWVVVPERPLGVAGAAPAPPIAQPAEASAPTAHQPVQPASEPAPAAQWTPGVGVPVGSQETHLSKGPRTGVIWLGVLLIVFGSAVLVDRMLPGLNVWGLWPVTLLGLFFIASGIRTMVTKEGDA